ncbi:fructose bisphosphate aldolase [Acidipropionibacterium jensenii]|uniref:fructose bisphosphate aldolase n=2 Tax=Acidipropionibacterium jensenii TaxID=1749 RepID=UPI0026480633|nr:fructose bisphosphate aldolase [Acidipropionibacterium jensenii]
MKATRRPLRRHCEIPPGEGLEYTDPRRGDGRGRAGCSTPKALHLYGIEKDRYVDDEEMFDLVHAMRTRIVTSPAFSGEQILAAILFEQTMGRQFAGRPAADYLWETKNVVPFLKVDKGLAEPADGVRVMKPIPGLAGLLERAVGAHIFGTKMRSVIDEANPRGIDAIVAQQFELGHQICEAGLVPILEPEVTVTAQDKSRSEALLLEQITRRLDSDPFPGPVMFTLSIPTVDNLYAPLIANPAVLRVVALSGGYSRDEADALLARNHGLIASFSRALSEGLSDSQTDEQFNATLAASIDAIYHASLT